VVFNAVKLRSFLRFQTEYDVVNATANAGLMEVDPARMEEVFSFWSHPLKYYFIAHCNY